MLPGTIERHKSFFEEYVEEFHGKFKWLRRDSRGPTYNSFAQFDHRPACSFEWGSNGYGGCTNYGGELLYLAAPSPARGLVSVRGTFSTSDYATLSRTQVEFGGPSTFGLEIAKTDQAYTAENATEAYENRNFSSFQLGDMIERGSFNYRWPFNEYYLDQHQGTDDKVHHVGVCQMFSCSKDRTFYQVLRIDEIGHANKSNNGNGPFSGSQVVLTIGGPVWFLTAFDELKKGEQKRGIANRSSGNSVEGTTIRYWDLDRLVGLEMEVFRVDDFDPKDKTPPDKYRLHMEKSDSAWDSLTPETQGKFPKLSEQSTDPTFPAYNAVVNLPTGCKSATFVAVIRFVSSESLDDLGTPLHSRQTVTKIPSSLELYSHVGVDNRSLHATGAFWKTVFTKRRERSAFVLSFSEFSLIGRALEKILQVDLVQPHFGAAQLLETVATDPKTSPLAIVSNVFTHPEVDLASLFWKVRFLVRTHIFITRFCETQRHLDEQDDEDEPEKPTDKQDNKDKPENSTDEHFYLELPDDTWETVNIAETQASRIRNAIMSVIKYLVKSLLNRDDGKTSPLMPKTSVAGDPQYYYVMMTIWYVCRSYPDEDWSFIPKEAVMEKDCRLFEEGRLPLDSETFGSSKAAMISLLQWYHYGSLLSFCTQRKRRGDELKLKKLQGKVIRLTKEAKIVAAAKLTSGQPYQADDEIFDRLAFLSDELGLERVMHGEVGAVVSFSMKCIGRRENTRALNPGWLDGSKEGWVTGPWEIHALCHHSRLALVGFREMKVRGSGSLLYARDEIDSIKRSLYAFVNGEGTISPSWERSSARSGKGWLHSEATAILATTMLVMNGWDMKIHKESKAAMQHPEPMPGKASHYSDSTSDRQSSHFSALSNSTLLSETRETNKLLKDQLKALQKAVQSFPIDWEVFALPRRYHPLDFFESLESTSEEYQHKATTAVSLPHYPAGVTANSSENVVQYNFNYLVPFIKYFGLFDIGATEKLQDANNLNWRIKVNTMKLVDIATLKSIDKLCRKIGSTEEKSEDIQEDRAKRDELNKPNEKLCWALYRSLVDQEVQHRFMIVRSPEVAGEFFKELYSVIVNSNSKTLLDANDATATDVERTRRQSALDLLKYVQTAPSDPNITQDLLAYSDVIQNLLSATASLTKSGPVLLQQLEYILQGMKPINPTLPKDLEDLLLNVIHREAEPCLVNHALQFPRFSCDTRDTWIASITLRNWRVASMSPQTKQHSTFSDDEPIYIPQYLKTIWGGTGIGHDKLDKVFFETLSFKLDTSSIVLSTNTFGDFSKCTIISDFMSNEDMMEVIKEARKAWNKFIHQPQTGRCLVFLMCLGAMCRRINEKYRQAISMLTPILSLNSDLEWMHIVGSDNAPYVFELGLWCIDTLQKLQDALEISTKRILEAKENMFAQIKDGPGKRSPVLEEMCQKYLADFESNLELLVAVNTKLESRIDLKKRHQKSFSDVLAMQESQAVLWQKHYSLLEHGVSRLTYVTIAYLPPALIAAILTIPETQDIINQHMGLGWFLGSIAILSAGTYFIAYYVDHILSMAVALVNYLWYPSPLPPSQISEIAQKKSKQKDDEYPRNIWRNRGRSRSTDVEVGKDD